VLHLARRRVLRELSDHDLRQPAEQHALAPGLIAPEFAGVAESVNEQPVSNRIDGCGGRAVAAVPG
jgi:hypothetical protein